MPQKSAASGGKVKYDGLPAGTHTYVNETVPCNCKGKSLTGPLHSKHPAAAHTRPNHTRINPGDVVSAGNLDDGTRRSHQIRGHLDRGVCASVGGGGS